MLRRGTDEERFDVSAAVPTLPAVLQAWLASVRDRTPAPVTFADGLATLEVAAAIYRAGESGSTTEPGKS